MSISGVFLMTELVGVSVYVMSLYDMLSLALNLPVKRSPQETRLALKISGYIIIIIIIHLLKPRAVYFVDTTS